MVGLWWARGLQPGPAHHHGVHSSASAGQESGAAGLPSGTRDFHARSCLQLGRNCFGAASNTGILTAAPWQCEGEGRALLMRVTRVLQCGWVWGCAYDSAELASSHLARPSQALSNQRAAPSHQTASLQASVLQSFMEFRTAKSLSPGTSVSISVRYSDKGSKETWCLLLWTSENLTLSK